MWDQFSNSFSGFGSGGYTPATNFNVQQSAMPSFSGFGGNNQQLAIGSNPYQAASPDWFSTDGAAVALQGLQSIFNWTQGNKALDLARDQFNFSKDITQKNLANQTSLLNTAMQDRQNARRSTSSSYQDTGSYMDERGL